MIFQVGIIGLGTVSGVHLNALKLLEQVKLVAACDIVEERKQKLPEDVTFYVDFHEMLEKETLDAVHICLPHYLHYEVAKACAEKGIHVLCEKPSTMDREQLSMMSRLDKDYNIILGISLQNRLNPTFTKLQEMIESQKYGKLLGLKAVAIWARSESYYKEAPWRGKMSQAGGGCMINQAIHTLDQMQLLGGKIKSVKGQICNLLNYDIEVEDTACAHINFENGVRGIFFGTVGYIKNSSIELQAVCEKGSFTIKDYALWFAEADNENEKTLIVRDKKMEGSKAYYGASHCELIKNYYEVLDGKSDRLITMEQEGKVILLIDTIRKSSFENKELLWEDLHEQN